LSNQWFCRAISAFLDGLPRPDISPLDITTQVVAFGIVLVSLTVHEWACVDG